MPMFIATGALGLFFTTMLSSAFTGLVAFFVQYMTKRLAMSVAAIGLMLALTATFITTMGALISGVAFAAPSELVMAWGWFMPSNADECLSAYFAAYTARWVYDTNYNLVFKKGLFGSM